MEDDSLRARFYCLHRAECFIRRQNSLMTLAEELREYLLARLPCRAAPRDKGFSGRPAGPCFRCMTASRLVGDRVSIEFGPLDRHQSKPVI